MSTKEEACVDVADVAGNIERMQLNADTTVHALIDTPYSPSEVYTSIMSVSS